MQELILLPLAVLLDIAFGDPRGCPHIVVFIGRLIDLTERALRRIFPKTKHGELAAGALLAVLLPAFCFALCAAALFLCQRLHPALAFAAKLFICWQCLAVKSLSDEALRVKSALDNEGLGAGRHYVSRIVGRETDALDEQGVVCAAVETVAENLSDGVIAPMLFICLGSAPLGVLYKAVNTLDSMVGYKNERYLYFGRASARLDDLLNLVPSRLSALFMLWATALCKFDYRNAKKIFLRDRYNHKSPNSAQCEAVCAGALNLRLGGPNRYFGKLVQKPYIGDDTKPAESGDIARAVRLMRVSAYLAVIVFTAVRGGLLIWKILTV